MSYNARMIDVPASVAFAALLDPTTYPHWLVGAERIRSVDANWPAIGSRFHHAVGFGPLAIPDNTEVMAIEQDRLLRLKVRARPFVTAVATFGVHSCERGCVVTLEEEPTLRLIGNLVRPVLDPLTHVRNHRSLCRLADLLLAAAPAA